MKGELDEEPYNFLLETNNDKSLGQGHVLLRFAMDFNKGLGIPWSY